MNQCWNTCFRFEGLGYSCYCHYDYYYLLLLLRLVLVIPAILLGRPITSKRYQECRLLRGSGQEVREGRRNTSTKEQWYTIILLSYTTTYYFHTVITIIQHEVLTTRQRNVNLAQTPARPRSPAEDAVAKWHVDLVHLPSRQS